MTSCSQHEHASYYFIPMTHASETGTENRLHFSGTGFWYVCHANRTRFIWYQKPVPNRTLFYSEPETGMHMTEMMIYHCLLFIFVISCK